VQPIPSPVSIAKKLGIIHNSADYGGERVHMNAEIHYDDLKALLHAYICCQANPDRVNCPSTQTLESLFFGNIRPKEAEAIYEHLPRCRECLVELYALRDMGCEGLRGFRP
jgi:hypothetical protein